MKKFKLNSCYKEKLDFIPSKRISVCMKLIGGNVIPIFQRKKKTQ